MALALPIPAMAEGNPEPPERYNIILSDYVKSHNIPIQDIEKYVRRSTEERLSKKNAKPDGGRPSNAFMLYRVIYQAIANMAFQEVKQNNTSKICADSWHNEHPELKQRFKDLSKIEKEGHTKAWGDHKYRPKKKKGGDGRKTLAERKTSVTKQAQATKASKTPDAHKHLRAPLRSPEPTYFQLEGTPFNEVPSLDSYQGTPMTSCVPTPQPQNAQLYCASQFDEALFEQFGPGQLPYGNSQVNHVYSWNPGPYGPQPGAFLVNAPGQMVSSNYPEPPMPQIPFNPSAYQIVHADGYQQPPMHAPHHTEGMQPSQPVLRDFEQDAGGVINPQHLAMPTFEVDPNLPKDFDPNQAETMSQPMMHQHDTGAVDHGDADSAAYLEFGNWVEESS